MRAVMGRIVRGILLGLLVVVVLLVATVAWVVLSTPQPREMPGWSLGRDLPVAHGELASAVVQRAVSCPQPSCPRQARLAVVGGIAGLGRVLDSVYFYDPQRRRWREGPALPAPRHHTTAAALAGSLYVSGGVESIDRPWRGETSFWRLDPDSQAWREAPAMPEPRWGHRLVEYHGRLYAVGGQGPGSRVLIYTPGEGWSTGAQMPVQRDHLSVVVVHDEIWAIGGRAPRSLPRVDIYDPAADIWREGPNLPKDTSGAAEGVVDGHILIFGGEEPANPGRKVYDRHWMLDTTADDPQWQPAPAPPLAVHGADGAVLDGVMMIAGGASRPGRQSVLGWTGTLQILDPVALTGSE